MELRRVASPFSSLFVVLPEILYTVVIAIVVSPFVPFTFESFTFSDFLFLFFMECLDSQILLLEERVVDVLLMLDFLSLCVCVFYLLLEL